MSTFICVVSYKYVYVHAYCENIYITKYVLLKGMRQFLQLLKAYVALGNYNQ